MRMGTWKGQVADKKSATWDGVKSICNKVGGQQLFHLDGLVK